MTSLPVEAPDSQSLSSDDWSGLVGGLHEAVVAADVDDVVLYMNRAAEELLGWEASQLIGTALTSIMPERFRTRHEAGFARFVQSGQASIMGRPLRLPALRMDGSEIEVELVVSAADLPFGTVLVGLLRDVSDRVELEGSGEVADALIGALTEASTLSVALPRMLEGLGRSLDWDVVQLWGLDEESQLLQRRAWWARDPAASTIFTSSTEDFASGVGLPGTVWDSGDAAWVDDVAHDPGFRRARAAAAAGLRSAFAFPLTSERGVVGVIEMLSTQPHGVSGGIVRQMTSLGSRLGGFIERRAAEEERLTLLESERAARAAAELARARLVFLSEASTALSESLDLDVTLQRITALAVPALGDWCVIHLVDDAVVSVASVSHADASKAQLLREAHDRYPVNIGAAGGVGKVIATGEMTHHSSVSDEILRRIARDDEHLTLLRCLDFNAVVTVPLLSRRRVIGSLTVATSGARRLTDDTVDVAVELARRAATALDNARLHRELEQQAATSASLARTLQQSLLPPTLPQIDGLRLAARYLPATRGMEVGGDFYDVFRLGRDTWGVVVGDVCGHGAAAAASTAFARYTLRAAATQTRSPRRALQLLNEAMLLHNADLTQPFVTVVNARVRIRAGGATVTIANGGHPLPLLHRHTAGVVETVGDHGTLLGLLADIRIHEEHVELRSGDRLVIVTDGVLEARRDRVQFGEQRLADIIRHGHDLSIEELTVAIGDAALRHAGGDLNDDIAIVAIEVP